MAPSSLTLLITVVQRTILFVDQVGSTRQLAEIGDEAVVAIRQRLWSAINDAAAAHDGRVFSDEGDGGALVFESIDNAVSCALGLISTTRSAGIALRGGLHTGPVIPNGDGFVGMTVHTSARLCDSAPSGYVLTTSKDTPSTATCIDFGQRTLKGFAEPVGVMLLIDPAGAAPNIDKLLASATQELMPSSTLVLGDRDATFVGRRSEVEDLQAFPGIDAGVGVETFLIAGDPGAGKSVLARRRCNEMIDSGVLCLVGRADEALDDPLHEVIEPLAHLVRHAPIELLADHVVRHGDLLTRWIPGLGDRIPSAARATDAAAQPTDRRHMHEAVADLLDAASRIQPIVLLIEDIHWATPSSLEVLRQLIGGRSLPGVSIIATYRSTEVSAESPLAPFLARVGRSNNVQTAHLSPLTSADIRELVTAELPIVAAEHPMMVTPIVDHIERTTAGNALFCAQVLRHLDDHEVLARRDDALDDVITVPSTMQDLARHRVDALGDAAAEVLAAAAVLGESFRTRDLLHMSGAELDVLDVLDRAERAGLIRPEDSAGYRFRFEHALVQQALQVRMTTSERLRRHRRAADAVRAAPAKPSRAAELLRHLQASGVLADSREVVAAASRSAEDATERLALRDAVSFRQLAADTIIALDDAEPIEVAQAWIGLGLAQTAIGDKDGAVSMERAAASAREAGDWELFARIAVEFGGDLKENQAAADVSIPVALATEALQHHDAPTAIRARLLMSSALWQRQWLPYAERRPIVDEAMSIAASLGDDRIQARLLTEWHRALHGPNVAHDALEASYQLDAFAASLNDPALAFQATNIRLLVSLELGDFELTASSATAIVESAEQMRSIEGQRLHLMWRQVMSTVRGDFEEASSRLAVLEQLLEGYSPDSFKRFAAAIHFSGLWMQGEHELVYSLSPHGHDRLLTLAWFAAESGRVEDAQRFIDEAGGAQRFMAQMDYMWWHDAVGLTRSARITGDVARSAELYDAMLPYRSHNAVMGMTAFLGTAEHHLGSLARTIGRLDDAVEHFDAAVECHEQIGAAPFLALSRAELAEALARRDVPGDAARCAQLSELASKAADRLGLVLVSAELERVAPGAR